MANTGCIMAQVFRRFYSLQASRSLSRTIYRTPLRRLYVLSKEDPQTLIQNKEIGSRVQITCPNLLTTFSQRNCSTFKDFQNENAEKTGERGHPNRRTLYAGSLNFLTTESRLKDHFSQYGQIEKIRVLHKTSTMIPNNYAFVQFKTVESLEKALEEKHFVDSRWLEVRKHDYDAKIESKIHIKDIPLDVTEKDINDYFSRYGKVESVTIPLDGNRRKDFGFVAFSSEEGALQALAESFHSILGNVIKASTFIAKRRRVVPGKVVVDLLPDNITMEDVKSYFEEFAPLNSVDMVFQRDADVAKNFAFLAFQDENAAHNIIKDSKKHFINGQEVIVQPMFSTAKLRALSREKKVFIEGIPLGKTPEDVCTFFNQFGQALHVHLIDSWAKHHGSQCGILRFRKKADVDNIVSQPQIDMDGCVLTVRRLGYTAKTSPDYTPLYLEFRKKHRFNPTSSSNDPRVAQDEVEHKALRKYPNLK